MKIIKKYLLLTISILTVLTVGCYQPFTYSKKLNLELTEQSAPRKVKAAGILPYCVDLKTGQVRLFIGKGPTKHACLLGLVPCSVDKWSDFGGAVEYKDFKNQPDAVKETAAREAYEETMGYLSHTDSSKLNDASEIAKGVDFWKKLLVNKNRVYTSTGYDYWFVKIPCTALDPAELRNLYKNLPDSIKNDTTSFSWISESYFLWKISPFAEKIDYRWIPAKELISQVTAQTNKQPVFVKDPENSTEKLELYSRFVESLKEGIPTLKRIIKKERKNNFVKVKPKKILIKN